MAVDLKGMGRKELEALKKRIETQLGRLDKADMKLALKAAEQAARKHGFSLGDLTDAAPAKAAKRSKPKAKGPKSPPKYAHPENPLVTWTGRGRQPDWIKEGLAAGKQLAHFLIEEEQKAVKTVKKAVSKARARKKPVAEAASDQGQPTG